MTKDEALLQETTGSPVNRSHAMNPLVGNAVDGTSVWASKFVLLVDTDVRTRESRAKVLRQHGVIVHVAATPAAALARFAASKYNLVLVDLGRDHRGAEALAGQIKTSNPHQRLAFLVGRPLYLASSLKESAAKPASTTPAPVRTDSPALPTIVEPSDFAKKIRKAEAEAGL